MKKDKLILLAAIVAVVTVCAVVPVRLSRAMVSESGGRFSIMKKQPGLGYNKPETLTYYSHITKTERHATVFLPFGYTKDKKYPVLYLFHGLNGSHRSWKNKSADVILQNLYYSSKASEMIVVCPNSAVNRWENTRGLKPSEKRKAYDLTAKEVVENLMPVIESRYSVKKGRDNTAVAGNSMGGRNALYTAFTYPDTFGYVGAFSPAYVLERPGETGKWAPLLKSVKLPSEAQKFKLLMMCVGRSDRRCGDVAYKLHDVMSREKTEHVFYDMKGGHDDGVWQKALQDFAARIFK